MRRLVPLLALVALAAATPTGAADLPGSLVAAGPGSFRSTYATPVTVVEVGGSLTFANYDVFNHDLVADGVFGPDSAPWCDRFAPGRCPLFWSPVVTLGGSTAVLGLENLEAGEVYPFYCTLHPGMKGSLVAIG